MKTKLIYFAVFFITVTFFTRCNDNDGPPAGDFDLKDQGVLILNQGNWGSNDAGLSVYDPIDKTMQADIFSGRLGDLAQDMVLYGNKLYISLASSNLISVVDINTLTEITKITTNIDNSHFSPYRFAVNAGKVYVTVQESTSRNGYVFQVDTTSLEIVSRAQVGINPEGIAHYGNKLYVANTGTWGNYDNTLSVIDIHSFEKIDEITVGTNPYLVQSAGDGKLFLNYRGNYDDIAGGFQIIDVYSKKVETKVNDIPFENFTVSGDIIYFYGVSYNDKGVPFHNGIQIYDLKLGKVKETSFASASGVEGTPYAIDIHPVTKELYLATYFASERGKMYVFDTSGNLKTTKNVGFYPCKFAFY